MQVLFVSSGTQKFISPFVKEQGESLTKLGVNVEFFLIKKGGIKGYLESFWKLKKRIRQLKPDILHAHYGLSGLLANLQRQIPVVTTFHGSDVNNKKNAIYSKSAYKLSAASIFVEKGMSEKFFINKKKYIIPCGVDPSVFYPVNKSEALEKMNLDTHQINVLFSSAFTNEVKNFPLAEAACKVAEDKFKEKINLIQLKGYSREEVNLLMNACDIALMTSFSEGSPQFIKEAMLCNMPIVSTNVGDIKWLFGDMPGHYLSSFEAADVAEKIISAIHFRNENGFTKGNQRLLNINLDSTNIAKQIIKIYKQILSA